MGKINVLSFAVANLIAAGEVVDRPSSVIKELIENSIDAGADRITVEIQNGGISYMRVTDNGCGISKEDLPVALRRHATSKIKDAQDLEAIISLGFRGEALAAISSVANVRIVSKTRESELGAALEAHGGVVVGITDRACSDGTSIIVEDLFYNVPARRKFLKKNITEGMAVVSCVERVSLSHPEISFRLISDGNIKLETTGDGKLHSAIYSVFGRDFANRLIPVQGGSGDIEITGYIGRSDNVKGNRNFQNFFINGRYVRSKTAMAALEQAFSSYIPPEKFPCCVLFVKIDPRCVDVNVHPSKLEIKFSNERDVFEAVYYAVRNALEKNTTRPEVRLENGRISAQDYRNMSGTQTQRSSAINAFVPIPDKSVRTEQIKMSTPTPPRTSREVIPAYNMPPKTVAEAVKENVSDKFSFGSPKIDFTPESIEIPSTYDKPRQTKPIEHVKVETSVPAPKKEETVREIPPYRIVGEAFNSYVFIDLGEKMLVVDKHAAHERIIFEHFKKIMEKGEQASQMLMLPVKISFRREEIAALEDYRAEIESAGFTFETEENSVNVQSFPVGIEASAISDIFGEFATGLLTDSASVSITRQFAFEKALYQASCKAAIKAGRQYPEEHIKWLCQKLMELPDITFCPHGRPVAIEMTKNMLDHQFERL